MSHTSFRGIPTTLYAMTEYVNGIRRKQNLALCTQALDKIENSEKTLSQVETGL